MEKGKKFSVLGDSISTYAGYTPEMYDFYDIYVQKEAGMSSVEDTWWMQVIRHVRGELGYNNSISGSMVSANISISATAKNRQISLGTNGAPDVILFFMGTNDWAFSVLPQEFEYAYARTLRSLKELYPNTQICCATLIRGKDAEDPEYRFMNVESCISPRIYSKIIRKCVEKAELTLVDLEKYNVEYKTIDGIHPDVKGMKTIADLWIKELFED